MEFVVCFVADAKVIPNGWAVTSPCHHEFALHVSVCIFHFWSEPWWFLIVLDMYVRGHALLNALRRCSLSLVAAVSRSLVVVMFFMSLVKLMVRYSSNISQSVFFFKRTCRGLLCCLESMLNVM